MTFETGCWEKVQVKKSPVHTWLVALRFGVIVGVILFFTAAPMAMLVAQEWLRYVAMVGIVLWSVCGTAAVAIRKKLESSWS